MKNKIGNLCMILGSVLLLAALSLFIKNRREEQLAAEAVDVLMPQVVQEINRQMTQSEQEAQGSQNDLGNQGNQSSQNNSDNSHNQTQSGTSGSNTNGTIMEDIYQDLYDTEMTEVEIDGYSYIGYVTIPALELELPVMSTWDYTRLRKAPCRYTGSTKTDDLVIAAHNYKRHFGNISKLSQGDILYFTDMDGTVIVYEVIALDILEPTAVEEMTSGEYDLTLFTCTYGGESRVTLRCDRYEE